MPDDEKGKTAAIENNNGSFYRPKISAEAHEQSYSTEELERRKYLTESIIANLRIIDQFMGLELAAERISSGWRLRRRLPGSWQWTSNAMTRQAVNQSAAPDR